MFKVIIFKDDIMQELPPLTLVKTWLEIIQKLEIPISIREKRSKLLIYYFGSIEQAKIYVEDNDDYRILVY
ncbi:MAG: methylglyoxal synthase [Colwellia sp.]